MDDRQIQIIRAAIGLFSRLGIAKTTMNDIAREAGVARQTVYNSFPGKDDVLRAALRVYTDDIQNTVRARWDEIQDFGALLDIYFQLGPLEWYEKVHHSPEAAELIDGLNTIAAEEMAQADLSWVAMFETLFKEQNFQFAGDADPKEIAHFLHFTARNSKYGAQSRADMETRLQVLKTAVLALLKN